MANMAWGDNSTTTEKQKALWVGLEALAIAALAARFDRLTYNI